MAGAGPVRMTLRSDTDPKAIARDLGAFDAALAAKGKEEQSRFRLAARWYTQGQFAENFIDRLLSWFISLEVHPAFGTTDVSLGLS
jgi:hypothetical protein